jgi:ADP-ribosylation factor GTPase-activating protein 2/3
LQAQAAALQAKKDSGEMERLGMGVRKLGFGQVAGMSGEAAAWEAAARKKAAERAASGYVEPGASRSPEVSARRLLTPAWTSRRVRLRAENLRQPEGHLVRHVPPDWFVRRERDEGSAAPPARLFGRDGHLEQVRPAFPLLCSSKQLTAVSRSQYFGRDEDEAEEMEESILSANGLGNLESSARDAVRQIMDAAGIEDLSDVQNALRNGAMKLGDYLARYA